MEADERRERRRRRILENSESRISTILSGPDGTETRNAPAMEGGDVYSAPTSSAESSFLCRLVMLYSYSQANVIIPWFLIYISVEFFILRRIRSTNIFPEEFQPLLQMLPKETLPFDISFVASAITMFREMAQDSMFMTAGFLLTQYSLILSDFYISHQD